MTECKSSKGPAAFLKSVRQSKDCSMDNHRAFDAAATVCKSAASAFGQVCSCVCGIRFAANKGFVEDMPPPARQVRACERACVRKVTVSVHTHANLDLSLRQGGGWCCVCEGYCPQSAPKLVICIECSASGISGKRSGNNEGASMVRIQIQQ
jgi:hypothetical protein